MKIKIFNLNRTVLISLIISVLFVMGQTNKGFCQNKAENNDLAYEWTSTKDNNSILGDDKEIINPADTLSEHIPIMWDAKAETTCGLTLNGTAGNITICYGQNVTVAYSASGCSLGTNSPGYPVAYYQWDGGGWTAFGTNGNGTTSQSSSTLSVGTHTFGTRIYAYNSSLTWAQMCLTSYTVTVNAVPTNVNAGSDITLCFGQNAQLSGSASSSATNSSTIGTYYGDYTNGSPFSTHWHDSRKQFLYLASDLIAAGMSAGNINSLAFNVTGYSTQGMNFNLELKNTATSSLTSTYESGLTNVYSGVYTVAGTGWQFINFSTPFYWNGTSNLLVGACFDNASYTSNTTVQYGTVSYNGFNGTWLDNTSGCSLTSSSACEGTIPLIIFNFTPNVAYSWSPSVGLSATNISNPVAMPTANTTYTMTATANGCAVTDIVDVIVRPKITAGSISNQTICFNTSPAPFTANAPSGGDGSFTYQWQESLGCDGDWTNVSTAAVYDDPAILTQEKCYRRLEINGCGTVASVNDNITSGLILHYNFDEVEEPTVNLWSGGYNIYDNFGMTTSLVTTGEYFKGMPVYRLTMTPISAAQTTSIQTELWSHGVYGGYMTYLASTKYSSSIYWKAINKTDIVVNGLASNVGGWNTAPDETESGWTRSISFRDGSVASDKSDNVFFSFKCPSAVINQPIIIDFVAAQIERKGYATPFTSGTRSTGLVVDNSENNNNGTISAATAPTWTSDSKVGSGAYLFNGSNSAIDIGNPSSLQITGNQTISMWLYPTSLDARRNPYAKAYAGEGTITQEINGTINYYYGNLGSNGGTGNVNYQGFTMTSPVSVNQWVHIAIVRDLTNMKLIWYKNGVEVNQATALFSAAIPSSLNAFIGKGYVSNYNGKIDDFRIYSNALTAADILAIFNSSSIKATIATPIATDAPALSENDYVWTGGTSNAWAGTVNNWCQYNGTSFVVPGGIPNASGANVYIRGYSAGATACATTAPIISSSISVNNLTIESGKTLTISGSSTVNVAGNWTNSGTFTPGTGTVTFNGTSTQEIKSGGSGFYNVTFNNTNTGINDLTLTDLMTINGTGIFTNGIVNYSGGSLKFGNNATSNDGSQHSFVNGIVTKTNLNNTTFTFPVGKGTIWAPVGITTSSNISADFAAEYVRENPGNNWYASDMCNLSDMDHVSGVEHWLLTKNPTGGTYPDVTLYWKDLDNDGDPIYHGIELVSDITVGHWTGTCWKYKGGTGTGSITIGSVTGTGFTSYSPITLGTKKNTNPLPINLLSFNAVCENNEVDIIWSTASETNNDYFTILRSTDASSWDFVKSISGAGNSNTVLYYSTKDTNPLSGTSYYRLKQTDYDGHSETFSPVAVSCGAAESKPQISYYPNPFTSEVMVDLHNISFDKALLKVYDIVGKNVFEMLLNSNDSEVQKLALDLSKLPAGIYSVEFKSENYTNTSKIVKNY